MARKKKPDGNRPSRPRPKPTNNPQPELPDRRIMEELLRETMRSITGEGAPDTPLSRAQELLNRAFEERNESRRVKLAREALAICPDCADAYVLLGEHAANRKEALAQYEKGVAAGERALGAEGFQENAGHFWGVLETRPYMRARLGLAHLLWTSGRRDEAVHHLQEMLRLNPNDNQGVRYTLAGFLLFLDRDADLAKLLQQYPDEASAAWAYTKALLAFRQQGDTIEARRLLKAALKANKHVPGYLLGEEFPPPEPPGAYSLGDESEALNYIGSFMAGWKFTPGAIAWLRANAKKKKSKNEEPEPRGPLSLVKKWAREKLPQAEDVWQAEFRQSDDWLRLGGEHARPWLVLVASTTTHTVLAHQVTMMSPTPALLWDTLFQAMQHPASDEPHRPIELQVKENEFWEQLRPHLEEVGIALTVAKDLEEMEAVFAALNEHLGTKREPGLLDMPGIHAEQVASFYESAADFYQKAPWKKVGFEAAIKVECDKFQGGPWYAVLMGQSGLTIGLALYDDIVILKKMWAGQMDDEENARETVGTSVTYGEEWTIAVADLEAARSHGWKVARPDAYPCVFHKERGLSSRQPLAWELELLEACLRAVPDFVNRHKQDDLTREEVTVPVASGPLRLTLSWVAE